MKKSIIVCIILVLVISLLAFAPSKHKILYRIKKDGYYGYMNADKKLVVEPKYHIADYHSSEGLALARIEEGRYHCLNSRGKVVFSIEAHHIRDYKEGLAAFKKDGKWGFIDRKGNIVIEPQYQYAASFSEGFAEVGNFDKDISKNSFYINKKNEMMFDRKFHSCRAFSEGYGVVGEGIDPKHSKYGIIDRNGNIVVPIEHKFLKSVSDGLYGMGVFPESMPPDGTFEEWMGWSFIDIVTGEVQFEWPNSGVGIPHNGYLTVYFRDEEGYGIINTKGETVVGPHFRFISEIPSEGLYGFRRKVRRLDI